MSKESVKFHVESDDYFGTVATLVGLLRQTIHSKEHRRANIKTLEQLMVDLKFLRKEYQISSRQNL